MVHWGEAAIMDTLSVGAGAARAEPERRVARKAAENFMLAVLLVWL
jgi:hypothetical protein